MTHAIFSGKMRILQHNTPPKRVRRFPARPRKNTPTRPHERPRRVFAWALPCAKSTHQTATPYSAIFFFKKVARFCHGNRRIFEECAESWEKASLLKKNAKKKAAPSTIKRKLNPVGAPRNEKKKTGNEIRVRETGRPPLGTR